MTAGQQQWPGFHQDREPERMRQEREQEDAIKARNLSARIQAADPVQRNRIDRAIGRTFADAKALGAYDDSRVQDFRASSQRFRRERERYRWTQARLAGRAGRN